MKKKTKTKKKYHYWFYFNTGDYIEVSHSLLNVFSKWYTGSGTCLINDNFDISFYCLPEQAQKITKYIKSNFKGKVVRERHNPV